MLMPQEPYPVLEEPYPMFMEALLPIIDRITPCDGRPGQQYRGFSKERHRGAQADCQPTFRCSSLPIFTCRIRGWLCSGNRYASQSIRGVDLSGQRLS